MIRERIEQIKENIVRAKQAAGRTDDVQLVAVTKTRTVAEIREAIACGMRFLGENRVQEFVSKYEELHEEIVKEDIQWTILGHLQTNKVKYLKEKGTLIQSFDRVELADELNKRLSYADVLLQVNVSGEAQKSGAAPEDVEKILDYVARYPQIRVRGIMCIAENTESERVLRKQFELARTIFETMNSFSYNNVTSQYLSMGMSGDYELAIKEGANMVRIGTDIFGRRM